LCEGRWQDGNKQATCQRSQKPRFGGVFCYSPRCHPAEFAASQGEKLTSPSRRAGKIYFILSVAKAGKTHAKPL